MFYTVNYNFTKKGWVQPLQPAPKLESYKKPSLYCRLIIFIPSSTACMLSGIRL